MEPRVEIRIKLGPKHFIILGVVLIAAIGSGIGYSWYVKKKGPVQFRGAYEACQQVIADKIKDRLQRWNEARGTNYPVDELRFEFPDPEPLYGWYEDLLEFHQKVGVRFPNDVNNLLVEFECRVEKGEYGWIVDYADLLGSEPWRASN